MTKLKEIAESYLEKKYLAQKRKERAEIDRLNNFINNTEQGFADYFWKFQSELREQRIRWKITLNKEDKYNPIATFRFEKDDRILLYMQVNSYWQFRFSEATSFEHYDKEELIVELVKALEKPETY